MNEDKYKSEIETAARLISAARHAVVFTGAGVSTESGIPDFRSPGGLWDRFDQNVFDYNRFLNDPLIREKHWQLFRLLFKQVEPNPAHYAISRLHNSGHIKAVITQNIDNLHQISGMVSSAVCELHGSLQRFTCLDCLCALSRLEVENIMATHTVPPCPACGGILKPDVVFFGQPLPAEALQKASEESGRCDLFIVVGSTLSVYPAARMPEYALSAGARLIIINLSPTPLDKKAEINIKARAGEILPVIAARVLEA
jgi:NAD-dependent deacetylase